MKRILGVCGDQSIINFHSPTMDGIKLCRYLPGYMAMTWRFPLRQCSPEQIPYPSPGSANRWRRRRSGGAICKEQTVQIISLSQFLHRLPRTGRRRRRKRRNLNLATDFWEVSPLLPSPCTPTQPYRVLLIPRRVHGMPTDWLPIQIGHTRLALMKKGGCGMSSCSTAREQPLNRSNNHLAAGAG